MKDKHKFIARLFIVFFTVSVSLTVLPCGIINAHGLFGEVTSSTVTDYEEDSAFVENHIQEKRTQIPGINVYNQWFEIWVCIVLMIFIHYMYRLPRGDTIVTYKVRMDD